MGDRARSQVSAVQLACPMLLLAVVLLATSSAYGYHRDELYFRMLPIDWGYTDQPPLTPILVQGSIWLFGDTVLALRLPAIACAVGSLPLLALITREVGGGRLAQQFTVWGMAGATLTLQFGHVMLTASLDLVVWPAALLFVIRALLRDDGRWWLAAATVVGLGSYNKLLVVVLLVGVAAGLALAGPRRWFRDRWLWAAVALTGLIALPNILYQATHGWPQLEMGAALGAENAAEVRVMMWPFLVLLVGPVLAVFWVAAVVAILRRDEWRRLRFLPVAFGVVVAFVFIAGTQFYYMAGMLAVLSAVGAVPVADWARSQGRRRLVAALLGVNAAGCALTSLPLLPMQVLGDSGLADINTATADQVGWEEYVAQVMAAATNAEADAIIASNYGEAGALDRFGHDPSPVHSGHNALWDLGEPADDVEVVVLLGGQGESRSGDFEECAVVDRLDHGLGVDNEEQGAPIMVCRAPRGEWSDLWPRFRHLS